jgi:RNA recognition motif-containing protein
MLRAPLTGLTKTAKKILSIQKHPECASLFIGNLGFTATEDSLIDLFARHMKPTRDSKDLLDKEKWLHKVRMGTFEDSGKCKGLVDLQMWASNFTYTYWEQLDGPLSTLRRPSSPLWCSPTQGTTPSMGARWLWSTLLRMQLVGVVARFITEAQTKNRAQKRHPTARRADCQSPSA